MKTLNYCTAGVLAVCLSTQAQAEVIARDDIIAFALPQRLAASVNPTGNDTGIGNNITVLPEEPDYRLSIRTEQGGRINKITPNARSYFYSPPENADPNGGSDAFTYSVTNNDTGESDTARFNIIFYSLPAVRAEPDGYNAVSGIETRFAINANDSLNTNRSFSNSANPWSLKGGTVKFGTGDNKDLLIYKSKPGFTGEDKIWYTLKGSNLTTDWAEVTILVTDNSNSGNATGILDTLSTKRGISKTIDVLENDIGTELTLNTPSTWSLRGGRVFLENNRLRYVPNPNFIGQDKFWYTFSDSRGGGSWGEARIDVQNDGNAPYPQTQPDVAAAFSGKTTEINILDNDFGNDLQLKMPSPYSLKGGLVSIGSGKSVFYLSKPGFTGQDKFWYTVKDADGRQNWGEVTINVR